MGAAIAGPFPTPLMKLSRYRCQPAVRDAEAGWKSARPLLVPNRDSGTAGAAH